jgi:hypothetical protein
VCATGELPEHAANVSAVALHAAKRHDPLRIRPKDVGEDVAMPMAPS